jgi:hypothetical protein
MESIAFQGCEELPIYQRPRSASGLIKKEGEGSIFVLLPYF